MKKTLLAASIVGLLTSTHSYSNDYIVMDENNPATPLLLSRLIQPDNFSELLEGDNIVDVVIFFQNSYVDLLGQQVIHTRMTEWVGAINAVAVEQEMGFQIRIANALIAPSIDDTLLLESELDEDGNIEVLGASTLFFNAVFNPDADLGFGSPLAEFDIYNDYGGDIAVYVREFRESDDIANVLGRASFGGPVNMMFDRFTGTPSFAERIFDTVFTHEIGHNLGAGHETDLDDNPPTAAVDAHAATCGGQNTVMFSSLNTNTLVSYSDPELTNNDDFCGEAGLEDNRRVIIENAAMTALRGTAPENLGQYSLSSSLFTTSEQEGSATITVTRDGDLTQAGEVEVALFDNTAVQGADFINGIERAIFEPGESSTSVSFEILQDALDEGDEQIDVILRYPLRGELGEISTANLSVTDSVAGNTGVITVAPIGAVVEGADIDIVLNRTNGSDGQLAVMISTSDQTAFTAQDYQAFNGTVVFDAGETTQTITIPTIDDELSEIIETFAVSVTSLQTQVAGGNLIASIQDNEPQAGQFNISISSTSVSESAGSVTVIINRVNGTAGEANLLVTTQGGGNSIVPLNETVTFADGQTQQTVNITINDDTTEEIDQIITVNLEAVDNENVTTSFVTFTVVDNDSDSTAEPTPPAQPNAPTSDGGGGGGSTGLLGLLALSLAAFRRRKSK